jgi:molybdopterin converting factor small subunit
MATVNLRAPLKQRAGTSSVEVRGATVIEVIATLERDVPELRGYLMDEQGKIRRHVNVFVDGEPSEPSDDVSESAQIDIIQAITGGSYE